MDAPRLSFYVRFLCTFPTLPWGVNEFEGCTSICVLIGCFFKYILEHWDESWETPRSRDNPVVPSRPWEVTRASSCFPEFQVHLPEHHVLSRGKLTWTRLTRRRPSASPPVCLSVWAAAVSDINWFIVSSLEYVSSPFTLSGNARGRKGLKSRRSNRGFSFLASFYAMEVSPEMLRLCVVCVNRGNARLSISGMASIKSLPRPALKNHFLETSSSDLLRKIVW